MFAGGLYAGQLYAYFYSDSRDDEDIKKKLEASSTISIYDSISDSYDSETEWTEVFSHNRLRGRLIETARGATPEVVRHCPNIRYYPRDVTRLCLSTQVRDARKLQKKVAEYALAQRFEG